MSGRNMLEITVYKIYCTSVRFVGIILYYVMLYIKLSCVKLLYVTLSYVIVYYYIFTMNSACDSSASKKGATCFIGRATFLELVVCSYGILLYNCL